jgi:Ca2+:H+ antiporter
MKVNIIDKIFYGLLVFIPLALLANYISLPPIVVFVCAAIALIPLSKSIGEATEELTTYTGAAVGGLVNATFGNAPELIIAAFALKAGLLDVVKASITGSILSNLLLGLGLAIFIGGTKHKHQKFNATAAKTSGSTLLLAVIALIIPAIFVATSGAVSAPIIENLSIIVSALLIIAYIASLFFSLWTHQHLYTSEAADYIARWSKSKSIFILLICTLVVAVMSYILVNTIVPVVTILGWSQVFIGITIISVVGNIAEHVTAIRVALKNNMDLSFQIAIGSATQIAMFVAPVLVLGSVFFPVHMTLLFGTFELAAIILSVFIVDTVVEDGESNWFEGLLLLIAYAIIVVAFFFYR